MEKNIYCCKAGTNGDIGYDLKSKGYTCDYSYHYQISYLQLLMPCECWL